MWIELVKAAAELVKAMAWPIAVVTVALSFKPWLLSALPSLFHRKFELEGLGFKGSTPFSPRVFVDIGTSA